MVAKGLEMLNDGIIWVADKAGKGVAWLTREGLEFLGTGAIGVIKVLADCNEIFIIVALVGTLIIITGHKELGTKITSGTFISYIACKVVAAW